MHLCDKFQNVHRWSCCGGPRCERDRRRFSKAPQTSLSPPQASPDGQHRWSLSISRFGVCSHHWWRIDRHLYVACMLWHQRPPWVSYALRSSSTVSRIHYRVPTSECRSEKSSSDWICLAPYSLCPPSPFCCSLSNGAASHTAGIIPSSLSVLCLLAV